VWLKSTSLRSAISASAGRFSKKGANPEPPGHASSVGAAKTTKRYYYVAS